MLQVLTEIASYIEAPAADIAEGRTYAPRRSAEAERVPALIRVRHGSEQPENAYVVAQYRNNWFWIDDRDFPTKVIFNFILIMFSLTETGIPAQAAPVVTVPAR